MERLTAAERERERDYGRLRNREGKKKRFRLRFGPLRARVSSAFPLPK